MSGLSVGVVLVGVATVYGGALSLSSSVVVISNPAGEKIGVRAVPIWERQSDRCL